MSDEPKTPEANEPVAMARAEEVGYINARPSPPAEAAPPPVDAGVATVELPRVQAAADGRPAQSLRLVALAAALVAALGTFWNVYVEALRGEIVPAIGSGLGLDVKPAAAPAQSMVLIVSSTPDGGAVTVNGTDHGRTPVVLELDCSAGSGALTVTLTGYDPWSVVVPCHPGTEARVQAQLERHDKTRH